MLALQIALGVLAAIALVVAAWAGWQVQRMAFGSGRRWVKDANIMTKREGANYPEYPLMRAAQAVFFLCVFALIALYGFME